MRQPPNRDSNFTGRDPMKREKVILKSAIILMILFLIPITISNIFEDFKEKEYRNLFMSVRGVSAVESYLDYKGKSVIVGLKLNGSRNIHLTIIDKKAFTDTDIIRVSIIGGLHVGCIDYDGTYHSINIVYFMARSKKNIRVRNIADVIDNYNIVYDYIRQSFPVSHSGIISESGDRHTQGCFVFDLQKN